MRTNLFLSLLLGVALILLTALTGAADAVDPLNIQDNTGAPAGSLGTDLMGQTFVPTRARLHALQVRWIVSPDFASSPGARITLHLRNSVTDTRNIATAELALSEIRNGEFGKFVFPPIADSGGRALYYAFSMSPAAISQGYAGLWASDHDAYPDGSLVVNGGATDRDLVFRAYYEPDLFMWLDELGLALGKYSGGLAAAFFLFLLPGAALSIILRAPSTTALLGLGLAVFAASTLLLLILPIGGLVLAGILGASALVLCLTYRRWLGSLARLHLGAEWLLLPLAVSALLVGLLQIRDTPVPLWVDSLSHAQIIRSFGAAGRLPFDEFYHLGFHATTGLFVRLSGLPVPAAMLVMGPLLFLQTGLSVFHFSRRLTGSLVAGLASALGVWFLSPLPAYLTTWGRYPLMMGAALLPLALVAGMDWLDERHWSRRSFTLVALLFAGLVLTQVRLVIIYFAFLIVYALLGIADSRERRTRMYRLIIQAGLALAVGGAWLAVVFFRGLDWHRLIDVNAAAPSIDLANTIAILLSHHGLELLILGLAATLVGLARRSRTSILMLVWFGVLYLIASLPSDAMGALITPDLVLLLAFVPLAVLVGDAAKWLARILSAEHPRRQAAIWMVTAGVVALIGARDNASIVNPATVQFTSADTSAMEWIEKHTPPHARFLVNSFYWFGSAYVPSDGGGWISIWSDRPITYLSADSVHAVGERQIQAWLAAHPVDYVYLGRGGGVLTRREFACQPDYFRPVYQRDGIEIYAVVPNGVGVPRPRPLECDSFG